MLDKNSFIKAAEAQDDQQINQLLDQVKEEGNLSVVPILFELLKQYAGTYIENKLIDLLVDVRISGFKEKLIEAIQNPDYISIKAILVRICWESTFDFSENIDLFTQILLNDEFPIALEASTVIEEVLYNIDQNKRQKLLTKLKMEKVDEARTFLLNDIVMKLENINEEE